MSKATRVVIDGVSYPLDDTTAVDFSEAQSLSTAEKQQVRTNIGAGDAADVTAIQALIGDTALPSTAQTITGAIAEHETDISVIKSDIEQSEINALLLHENIPDTTETITFDSSGDVSTIVHTNGSNVAVRTDAFTFGTDTITEVRTLNTGESLTIATNTTTLTTTVTYAA